MRLFCTTIHNRQAGRIPLIADEHMLLKEAIQGIDALKLYRYPYINRICISVCDGNEV